MTHSVLELSSSTVECPVPLGCPLFTDRSLESRSTVPIYKAMPTIDRRTSADSGSTARNNAADRLCTVCRAMLVDKVFAWVFLMVVVDRIEAGPARMQRMTVSKTRAEDLESSGTGYVYNQQQGLPVYYLHYTDHGSGSYYHTPDAAVATVVGTQYVAAPVAHAPILQPYAPLDKGTRQQIVTYPNRQLPDHVALPVVHSQPRAPYYFENTLQGKGYEADRTRDSRGEREGDVDSKEDVDSQEDIRGDDSSEESDVDDEEDEFYGSHENGGSRDSGGVASEDDASEENYKTQEYSEDGEDEEEDRKSRREFGESEQGVRENENREGYYSENGKREKGNVDEGETHGSHEEGAKGEKSSNYGNSSYRKKGEKTKGYHNVYHKDEYKKETDFYDEDHKKGYFDKFEKFDKGIKEAEGEFEKGGHRSSGHDQEDSGKKGYYDKGHDRSQDQGHRTEQGEKSYHSNHEDYAVKGGSKSAKEDKFHKDSDYH